MAKTKIASTTAELERQHVERMLARARRRAKQADKLVVKWEARLTEVSRKEVSVKQRVLWDETLEFAGV